MFRRLAVFGGPFPLASVERVVGADGLDIDDIDDAMAALVDRSLVLAPGRRFRLLEPVRQFASAELARSGEIDLAQDRHVADAIVRVQEIHDGLITPFEAQWVGELDLTWPDIRRAVRRALDTGDNEATSLLVTRLANEAFLRRPEAFAWINEAVTRFGDQPGPHRHALLGAGSYVAWTTLDVARALDLADDALGDTDTDPLAFDCLPQAGAVGALNYSGRPADAVAVSVAALERHGNAMDPSTRATMVAGELISRALAGEPDVTTRAEAALRTATRGANPSSLGLLWYSVAIARMIAGDIDGSTLAADRARTLAGSVRNQWLLGMCANPHLASGDPSTKLATALEAMDDALRSGWTTHAWTAGWSIFAMLTEMGQLTLAAMWLGACNASSIPSFDLDVVPAALDAAMRGQGDPELVAALEYGRSISFAELHGRTSALVDA